ncbi:hypothetical protein F5890DRAFT_799130 [Lentinula detonsa]|uniref:Uncharacterized protein n=1 Tax=Lentinula detonsa TaxID=2804962 RepID=A0AA38Q4E1_9AGAR|nr:hypothetical protein F5890DRAFT_799130 [Lentinula detonsa]
MIVPSSYKNARFFALLLENIQTFFHLLFFISSIVMFNFGKSKLPANWPPLHHKCSRSKCTFPNNPQPAPGTYKCRGCDKGTYAVSLAQAKEADARNRTMFYIPGRSPPPNVRPQQQTWDLNQEFPPYVQFEGRKRNHHSRANARPTANTVVRTPKPHSQGISDPHAVYPQNANRDIRPQVYSSYTLASTASSHDSAPRRGLPVPERAERKQVRPYRVVNI